MDNNERVSYLTVLWNELIEMGKYFDGEEDLFDITKFRTVLLLSVATSIDALAVGFGFAMMQETRIGRAVAHIGVVSFLMSLLGYGLTSRWSTRVKANVAEIIGGVVLILIGLKILLVK